MPNSSISIFTKVRCRGFLLGLLVLLSLVARGCLVFQTFGTNDMAMWQTSAANLADGAGANIYGARVQVQYREQPYYTEVFNHPPPMLHVLPLLHAAAGAFPLSFPVLFRLLTSCFDIGVIVLTLVLVKPSAVNRDPCTPLMLSIANPIAILISAFHGNTDPVMLFFLLLSIWLIDSSRSAVLAGLAFACAIAIKIVPLICLPVFLLTIPTIRKRLLFSTSVAGLFILLSLPYLFQAPGLIITNVLMYSSLTGHWGLSYLLAPLFSWPPVALTAKSVLVGAVLVLSFALNRRHSPPPLFQQCGLVLTALVVFGPGFGIQYLYWLVPWIIAASLPLSLLLVGLTGSFGFFVYNFWCGGFPWYLADSIGKGPWRGWLNLLQVLLWSSLLVSFLHLLRRIGRPQATRDF